MSQADNVADIRKSLGHLTFDWTPQRWLDTGNPALNKVIGHAEHDIPYGRIFEISGLQSHGKTAVALGLAAAAQDDGAVVLWMDFENSWDEEWAAKRGLDPEKVLVFAPYVGKFDSDDTDAEPRMATGDELCAEAEVAMCAVPTGSGKAFLVIDSVAAITTAAEVQAGIEGQTMRTRMELPMFLSALLRRWVALAQAHNVSICLVNQLRQKPMGFGDPWYTPGGNAIPFYAHVRVRLRRKKRLKSAGREVGVAGEMTASKNKSGGVQGAVIKYELRVDTGALEFTE